MLHPKVHYDDSGPNTRIKIDWDTENYPIEYGQWVILPSGTSVLYEDDAWDDGIVCLQDSAKIIITPGALNKWMDYPRNLATDRRCSGEIGMDDIRLGLVLLALKGATDDAKKESLKSSRNHLAWKRLKADNNHGKRDKSQLVVPMLLFCFLFVAATVADTSRPNVGSNSDMPISFATYEDVYIAWDFAAMPLRQKHSVQITCDFSLVFHPSNMDCWRGRPKITADAIQLCPKHLNGWILQDQVLPDGIKAEYIVKAFQSIAHVADQKRHDEERHDPSTIVLEPIL